MNSEQAAFFCLLTLVACIATALLARRKGYSPGLWFFSPILGLVILAFLPFANRPGLPPSEHLRLVRRGNLVALVICIFIAGYIGLRIYALQEGAQQLINGLALGAIYALIALGYTMVYGVLRFINFAHGDVFMLGAFAGYYLSPLVNRFLPAQSYLGGALVLVLAMLICAGLGMLIEFLAYRPLRKRPKLTVLITAIGVSLFIEYTCQHEAVFGAAPHRFPDLIPTSTWHLGGLIVNSNQVIVFVTTLILLGALSFIVKRTRVGTAMRAVAFNEQAAALMGVNINSIISFTFALGSALAAAGGILYAMNYASIEPLMGVQTGLKAFVAAVFGGIGNLPGAALGGAILGVVETFAGGIPGLSNYRDAIAFVILILVLLFRPTGLLGKQQTEKV